MGRHAKRAARLRVSGSTIVLGTLIVTVVAVGSLLSSYAEPAPRGADGVGGAAAAEDTVTDGRLLPFGLVLAALLVAGAAAAVLIDVRRGRRARTHAAPGGRRRAVATLSEAAQQVSAQQVSAQQVSAPQVSAQQVSAPQVSAPQVSAQQVSAPQVSAPLVSAQIPTPQVPAPDVPVTALVATDVTDPGTAPPRRASGRHARPDADAGETWWVGPASPSLTWISQPTTAPTEFVERQQLVDRGLSSVDLSFPFTASLADSLHDELFTHRAVRS
jgi:hypothetical protein